MSYRDTSSACEGIRRWRWLLIGAGTLILCSCRTVQPVAETTATLSDSPPAANAASQPARATISVNDHADRDVLRNRNAQHVALASHDAQVDPGTRPQGATQQFGPVSQQEFARASQQEAMPKPQAKPGFNKPWIPPQLAPPWPRDEYLLDGGDRRPHARVGADWTIGGLNLEDTIVHYDTLNGDTHVQPSNRVSIYAPRFAAVRRVSSVGQYEAHQKGAGVELPTVIRQFDDAELATTVLQPLQPGRNLGTTSSLAFRDRTRTVGIENAQAVSSTHMSLLPYEDFNIIRRGEMDNSEKARLAQSILAADTWTTEQAVQVVVDNVTAVEASGETNSGLIKAFEIPDGKSRVRVVKVASKQNAHPGDTVEFTIRFDNVGDQAIGNVTVVDNLTTRLEYVPDSQECTVAASFVADENAGSSLALRWEIAEPLEVGEGGVIRFQCRVR